MQTNQLPEFDDSVNTTGCCPRFNPEGWDGQYLHFEDKQFLRAETRSAMHIPLNMGKVFARVNESVEKANGFTKGEFAVLSHDISPWKAEHLFAVNKDIPGEEMQTLSGDFVTRVFEGPYSQVKQWMNEMTSALRSEGKEPKEMYFFYTTCPKCAKAYGKNYIVGIAAV
jgi:hypothetical protein